MSASTVMRCNEQIIKTEVVNHIEKWSRRTTLLPLSQHGFRKLMSCLSNLLEQQDYILTGLENQAEIDSIYSDLEKCFEKLDLKIMCAKLRFFGIKGKVLAWIINFVTNRKFYSQSQ